MSLYTAVFIRFVHGVLDTFAQAEAFLFHTSLVHVSDALREKNTERALDRLAAEMDALRRRCRRIVWLNPLIGWQGYEPSARGMAAALPYVDLFAPAHTLESLAALEPYLARL